VLIKIITDLDEKDSIRDIVPNARFHQNHSEKLMLQGFEGNAADPHPTQQNGGKSPEDLCIHAAILKMDFHTFHMVFHRKSPDFA